MLYRFQRDECDCGGKNQSTHMKVWPEEFVQQLIDGVNPDSVFRYTRTDEQGNIHLVALPEESPCYFEPLVEDEDAMSNDDRMSYNSDDDSYIVQVSPENNEEWEPIPGLLIHGKTLSTEVMTDPAVYNMKRTTEGFRFTDGLQGISFLLTRVSVS